ncbi:MAG: MBL fold metallo-hydrolase [Acidobacteriota bacterium]
MRIHHINCATMCPYGELLINGQGSLLAPGRMVCHCLLIETNDGLVLVETGLGLQDIAQPKDRLGGFFLTVTRPRLDPEETAVRQIARLGFRSDDVRHIVLTHLDLDHAGGLSDFPKAKVHVFETEHRAAMSPSTLFERSRYRAMQWAHGPFWEIHSVKGERWFGFDCVQAITGIPPEVLLIPLHGHTRGHCGVAVRTPERWLLHCGDAYFFHGEVDSEPPHCPIGLRLFQNLVQIDGDARMRNQARLRALAHENGNEVKVFCAHDPVEYAHMREVQPAYAV